MLQPTQHCSTSGHTRPLTPRSGQPDILAYWPIIVHQLISLWCSIFVRRISESASRRRPRRAKPAPYRESHQLPRRITIESMATNLSVCNTCYRPALRWRARDRAQPAQPAQQAQQAHRKSLPSFVALSPLPRPGHLVRFASSPDLLCALLVRACSCETPLQVDRPGLPTKILLSQPPTDVDDLKSMVTG